MDATRIEEIRTTLVDECERLDRGAEGRLESAVIARMLDEAAAIVAQVEQQGLVLTEAQYEAAAKRKDYAAYEYSLISDNATLLAKIEALRSKGDVVGLYLLTSQMPPGAMRSRAERPLVDVKAAMLDARTHAERIRELRYWSPETRRNNWEQRQHLPRITNAQLIERKRQQYGDV